MLEELKLQRYLYQDVAAYGIVERFGPEFVYHNANGNLAIDKRVLAEFRVITKDVVVWERGEKLWRFREVHDESGRQAD